MNKLIEPREAVKALRGFAPDLCDRTIGELRKLLKREDIIKLSFNESPYGPSEEVVAAMAAAASQAHLYHDPEAKDVRCAIANQYGLAADNVILSNGADEAIALIAQAFLSSGQEVITIQPSFGQYAFGAMLMGAKLIQVPVKRDMIIDCQAVAQAITDKTAMVFLCNPNNPTGTIIGGEELKCLLSGIPGHILVVLDEAYAEYVDDSRYISGTELLVQFPNVITVRTFSKIYGLAGLRMGYCLAQQSVIDVLDRVRSPFNVNSIAQEAVLAALGDEAYCRRIAACNKTERHRVTEALTALGYMVYPSQTNFIFADIGQDSLALCCHLEKNGIIIRPGSNWNKPSCVRITLGNALQNDRLIKTIREFLRSY